MASCESTQVREMACVTIQWVDQHMTGRRYGSRACDNVYLEIHAPCRVIFWEEEVGSIEAVLKADLYLCSPKITPGGAWQYPRWCLL